MPERATTQVPIRVGKSSIAGAGRGVFALKDVLAGGPIFSIREPLLNIIEDDEYSLSHTCDNCFAAKVGELWTVDVEEISIKFKACEGCKVLHYCSKACQITAWNHHHKYECKTYQSIINDPDPAFKSMLNKVGLRSIIRILELHKNHQIPQDEWNEMLSLTTGRQSKMKKQGFASVADAVANLAKTSTKSELTLDEIIDLFCMMHNNQLIIGVPLLKGNRSYDPKSYSVVSGGVVMDPLVAMMNHSCSANARWYSNGKELRIRARVDIKAGEELTICYDPTEDYTLRRIYLKDFDINCSCPLCKIGNNGPTGFFRSRLFHLADSSPDRMTARLTDIQKAIETMKEKNFGYGIHPMRDLHQQAYQAYFRKGKTSECLKLALKIYYVVEPMITPPIYADYRLCTLYTIVSLLNIPLPRTTDLEELPAVVKEIIPHVFIHLRAKLVADTEKCYGEDSIIATFERRFFTGILKKTQEASEADFQHVQLHGSREERENFTRRMNELLEWAGIGGLNEEVLV